ncbi:hypothetical protein ACKFKG_09885 [Phormidesmis sp. 146-35]
MRIRNAFATLMICISLALTVAMSVNVHKASAQSRANCQRAATGTYLYTANVGNLGSFRGVITLTQDGNIFTTASIQGTGAPPISQPFGDQQGSWKCTSDRETISTVLNFNYPTATSPGSITRADTRATFDPKAGTIQGATTGRTFALTANPLTEDAPISGTFTFNGQRVEPRQ